MKLSRIAGLLAAAGILAGAQTALASDGTITFQGEITANTCTISVDGAAASATVQLPPVSSNALAAADNTSGWTQFDISLTACQGTAATAMAHFESGTYVDNATGRLKNSAAANPATNVQIALREVG